MMEAATVSPAHPPESTTPWKPAERPRLLGMGLVAAALWRGWPEARDLMDSIGWQVRDFGHVGMLWVAWPLAIGAALVITRSRRLLKAATLACVAIGVERLLFLGVGLVLDSRWGWSSGPLVARTLPDVIPRGAALLSLIGSALFGLFLGLWSHRMGRARPVEGDEPAPAEPPIRGAVGRLALLGSLIFAIAVVGSGGWTLFTEMLQRFPSLRQVFLRGNSPPSYRTRSPEQAWEDQQFGAASTLTRESYRHQNEGNFREARQAFAKALGMYDKLAAKSPSNEIYRHQLAQTANNLAWFLVTWPDASQHAPDLALPLARRAVEIDPTDGNSWNTLGAVLYRSGDIHAALEAFKTSKQHRRGGDAYDWYFLAMIEARLKRSEVAKFYYDEAVTWTEAHRPRDPELTRFRAEAAALMGLPIPPPLPPEPARVEGPDSPPTAAHPQPSLVGPRPGMGRRRGR